MICSLKKSEKSTVIAYGSLDVYIVQKLDQHHDEGYAKQLYQQIMALLLWRLIGKQWMNKHISQKKKVGYQYLEDTNFCFKQPMT